MTTKEMKEAIEAIEELNAFAYGMTLADICDEEEISLEELLFE